MRRSQLLWSLALVLLLSTVEAEPEGLRGSRSGQSSMPRPLLKGSIAGSTQHRGALSRVAPFGAAMAYPIVRPEPGHTKLVVAQEGLDILASIEMPVAVVAVIGPYRSGKSFLLNQLLSLPCNQGFGVGHTRDTMTKGVWVWGQPRMVTAGGKDMAVLFVDTEGFESAGKSDVYDDRIFALSAIISSLLIYNLPETVREADIEKLSFAVELAEEFYGRVEGREAKFQPANLLWLIQRDFLEGITVQQLVDRALSPVENPDGDKDIANVNKIRQSLLSFPHNHTAFGLCQPHLQRTRLCDLHDSDMDSCYVTQREKLKEVVASLLMPKRNNGRVLKGEQLARLITQTVEALNKGDIPSVGSLVLTFNREVIERCMEQYHTHTKRLALPVDDHTLASAHEEGEQLMLACFDTQRFGHRVPAGQADEQMDVLHAALAKELAALQEKNRFESSIACEARYAQCAEDMDRLQAMTLPSIHRFDSHLRQCNNSFQAGCRGPAKETFLGRLDKMSSKERSRFLQDYNQRLFNGLVLLSLVSIVVFRFFLKNALLELVAWCLFLFLELYPKVTVNGGGMYDSDIWRALVVLWEFVVYNPVLDMGRWGSSLLWVGVGCAILLRCYCRCCAARGRKAKSAAFRDRHD